MICWYGITLDCLNAEAIAAFWRDALEYQQPTPTDEEVAEALRLHPEWATMAVVQDDDWRYPRLRYQEVPEAKQGRDRVRWQLGLPAEAFDAQVGRLIALGAHGQPPTMGHPAGNDFGVVPIDGPRRFTAILIEAVDVARVQAFWDNALVAVGDISPMPKPRFVQADGPKLTKNRMHLDLICENSSQIADERQRVLELGASLEDPSTGHRGMFDPEGNEFCLH